LLMNKQMEQKMLSRRAFLKLSGIGLAAAFLPERLVSARQGLSLGRVVSGTVIVYEQPSFNALQVDTLLQDMVVPIAETVQGEENERFGSEWSLVGNTGYVHASYLQPVEIRFQEPTDQIVFTGSLAEVTVPFADVYYTFSDKSEPLYRYYYQSTHWVTKMVEDRYGKAWYRVFDDKFPERERWVGANQLRILPYEELAPISPDVPAEEKRIEVSLDEQRMTAYEYDQPVYEAVVSTGNFRANERYQTPTGSYLVGLKRASQHMMPWDRTFGAYDLPGVPWVSYFTQRAHAFHGAYWHHGFGRIRSHGCVNLKPDDAKWVYLWTTPEMMPYNQLQYSENSGTRVIVR
ncbi:MAG TPA: L,D-transpeptidase family protein, partial [Anaerolineales bacterium]|nr:L,D-transpeptidase family protein [Anaerolineales bacterium]